MSPRGNALHSNTCHRENKTTVNIKYINVDMFWATTLGCICLFIMSWYSYDFMVHCTNTRQPEAAKQPHNIQYLSLLHQDGVPFLLCEYMTYQKDLNLSSVQLPQSQKHCALSTCIWSNSTLLGKWCFLPWSPLSETDIWCNWTLLFFHQSLFLGQFSSWLQAHGP